MHLSLDYSCLLLPHLVLSFCSSFSSRYFHFTDTSVGQAPPTWSYNLQVQRERENWITAPTVPPTWWLIGFLWHRNRTILLARWPRLQSIDPSQSSDSTCSLTVWSRLCRTDDITDPTVEIVVSSNQTKSTNNRRTKLDRVRICVSARTLLGVGKSYVGFKEVEGMLWRVDLRPQRQWDGGVRTLSDFIDYCLVRRNYFCCPFIHPWPSASWEDQERPSTKYSFRENKSLWESKNISERLQHRVESRSGRSLNAPPTRSIKTEESPSFLGHVSRRVFFHFLGAMTHSSLV